MPRYETPGVYSQFVDTAAGGVQALRTDVAGFVGIAERGPLHLAVPAESYLQFAAWFGSPIGSGYLAYGARAFFENGGRRLWAVRVASDAAETASALWRDDSPSDSRDVWRIDASSPGVWGNRLAVRLTETRRAQTRAQIDVWDPRSLVVDRSAGFGRLALIEAIQGGVRESALVERLAADEGRLYLREALSNIDRFQSLRVETITYTLEVFQDSRLIALYDNLSLVPGHPRYGPALLSMPWQNGDPQATTHGEQRIHDANVAVDYFRVSRNRTPRVPPPVVIRELQFPDALQRPRPLARTARAAAAEPIGLDGGSDGLAGLRVRDFVGESLPPSASDVAVLEARRGLAALALVDEVSILAVPDIHIRPQETARSRPTVCEPDPCLPAAPAQASVAPQPVGDRPPSFELADIHRVQAAMVAHCESRRDRIALLDAPYGCCRSRMLAATELRAWRSRFDTAFGALYAPWLRVVDPLRADARGAGPLTREIPPSGHVAGLMAASDVLHGVHAAPANASIAWLQDVSLALDFERHGLLNELGVNVIRSDPGRGLRVLGARTLSSDTDWRFINVRRLVSMIRRALDYSMQWASFEPNDWRLRNRLALVVGLFLRELWSRGALVGRTEDEAFFVRCDGTNNPPTSRKRGELLLEIGLAPSVPFEFIVLRIGRDANGFAMAESLAAA